MPDTPTIRRILPWKEAWPALPVLYDSSLYIRRWDGQLRWLFCDTSLLKKSVLNVDRHHYDIVKWSHVLLDMEVLEFILGRSTSLTLICFWPGPSIWLDGPDLDREPVLQSYCINWQSYYLNFLLSLSKWLWLATMSFQRHDKRHIRRGKI